MSALCDQWHIAFLWKRGYTSNVTSLNETALTRERGRRKEHRDRVSGGGELTWDVGTTSKQCPVEVSNISNGGAQLVARTRLKVGISAYLTGEQFRCMGSVCYCKHDPRGFLIGLKFSREPHFKNAVAGQ